MSVRGCFVLVAILGLVLVGGSPRQPSSLLYFTTSPQGAESVLFRADVGGMEAGAEGAPLFRQPLWTVEHAPGFQPRGALSDSGRAAWLALPRGRGVGDPALLQVADVTRSGLTPIVVDEEALYLQQPVFQGERLLYLRGSPAGDPNLQGTAQHAWTFSLLGWSPGVGQPVLLRRSRALWVMLVGLVPSSEAAHAASPADHLVLLEIHPFGPILVELDGSGALVRRWSPGADLVVRDLAVDPDGRRSVVFLGAAPRQRGASLLRLDLDTGDVDELRVDLSRQASPRLLPGGRGVLVTEPGPGGNGLRFPQQTLEDGAALYRVQGDQGLSWVYARPGSPDRRLAPAEELAQDVSVLGFLP